MGRGLPKGEEAAQVGGGKAVVVEVRRGEQRRGEGRQERASGARAEEPYAT